MNQAFYTFLSRAAMTLALILMTATSAWADEWNEETKTLTVTSDIVESYSYSYRTEIEHIVFSSNVTIIQPSAFDGCPNLKTVTFVEGSQLDVIGSYAFRNCTSLKTVTIPDNTPLTSIWQLAFKGCTSLESITLPNRLNTIRFNAFEGCTSLTTIHIPASLTSIESDAFYGCTSLTTFTVDEASESFVSDDGVLVKKDGILVCYPTGRTATSYTVPDGVKTIQINAFFGCTSLRSVILPPSLRLIQKNAFANCTNLATVYALSEGIQANETAFDNINSDCYFYVASEYYKTNDKRNTPWYSFRENMTVIVCASFATGITATTSAEPFITYNGAGYYAPGTTFTINGYDVPDASTGYSESFLNYVVTNTWGDDITSTVLSGETLTLPDCNVKVSARFAPIVYSIAYDLDGGTVATANPDTYTVESGDIKLNTPRREGFIFTGWTGTGLTEPTKKVTIAGGSTGDRAYTATWEYPTYIDADGIERVCTTGKYLVKSYSHVAFDEEGDEAWYLVDGNVTINGHVYFNDNTHIILFDGANLTINGEGFGITAPSLTIYGQTQGTGSIEVTYLQYETYTAVIVHDLTINGGCFTAHGYSGENLPNVYSGNAIYATNNVTINSGYNMANAQLGPNAAGKGILAGGDIILGWRNPSDRIYSSSYQCGGSLIVKDGQNLFTIHNGSYTLLNGTVTDINDIYKAAYDYLKPCCMLTLPECVTATDNEYHRDVFTVEGTTYALPHSTVTLSYDDTPPAGYTTPFLDLTVKDADNTDIALSDNSFTMPPKDVIVTGGWTAIPATVPTITTQPTNQSLLKGYTDGCVLTVAAEEIDNHTLTYQWYSNTSNSAEGGTAIEGATASSYTVPTGLSATAYYYCIVTATRTDNGLMAMTTSDVSTVTIKIKGGITLADDTDNSTILSDNEENWADVTLQGRTLYRDGNWNTLCLPFAVSDFAGTPLAGFTVMELDGTTSSLNNEGTLTLNFNYANAIEAGKPYIAKWEGADVLIHSIEDWNAFAASVAGGNTYENQTVKLVTDIGTSQNPVTTMAGGTFKGTFDGGGHNINAVIRGSGDGTALFYHISGATIKNLRVEGWIKTDGTHPANIAALVSGVSTISNCSCWADVLSTKKLSKIDGGTVVGLINAGATLNMTDVYSRAGITYEYSSSYGGGGIVGWTGSSTTTANLERCLYSPYEVDIQYTGNEPSYYFVSGPGQKNLTKCVYDPTVVAPALTAQGTTLLNYNMDDIWKYLSWDMGYDRSLKLPMTVAIASADDIVNPVFGSVIIDADTETAIDFDGGQFVGTYSPVALPVNEQSNLFLGSNNTLYYPNGANNADGKYYLGACRAYFHIGSASLIRRFVLNFGDDDYTTDIIEITKDDREFGSSNSATGWYTLDGRKLLGKPTQKGIYVNNGRKVVIK